MKAIGSFGIVSFALVLVGPMLYQCFKLCIDYYNQPVTTNIYVENINQSSFLPKLQFCFDRGNYMNITKAQSMGLNESHQYYLQNYIVSSKLVQLIPAGLFDNLTNETSLETYMQRLFGALVEIEYEIIRIAERVLNSSNPMEFWNMNQPNNLVPMRFTGGSIDTSTIVGPYTNRFSWAICYDIPSSPVVNLNDRVYFKFNFSVNRKESVGYHFLLFSPYIGDAVVFDPDEFTLIDYVKDPAKYMTSFSSRYTVDIKKWTALNKWNSYCLEGNQLNPMIRCPFSYNVGHCEFQCVKDYYWHHFNCVYNGTYANRCHHMKIVRILFDKHRVNAASYATTVHPSDMPRLKSSLYEFSTAENKFQALSNVISGISAGHELFVIENCGNECRIRNAPPFCDSWKILPEKTYSLETLRDVENASIVAVHDIDVQLTFKIKRSMLVYEQVSMISLENFVGQLGGLIGLYIGWSFLSVGMFALAKLTKLVNRPTEPVSEGALFQQQMQDMISAHFEAMQRRMGEAKS